MPPCFSPAQILQRKKHWDGERGVCRAEEFKLSICLGNVCPGGTDDWKHWTDLIEGRKPEQDGPRGMWGQWCGLPSLLLRIEVKMIFRSLCFLFIYLFIYFAF